MTKGHSIIHSVKMRHMRTYAPLYPSYLLMTRISPQTTIRAKKRLRNMINIRMPSNYSIKFIRARVKGYRSRKAFSAKFIPNRLFS